MANRRAEHRLKEVPGRSRVGQAEDDDGARVRDRVCATAGHVRHVGHGTARGHGGHESRGRVDRHSRARRRVEPDGVRGAHGLLLDGHWDGERVLLHQHHRVHEQRQVERPRHGHQGDARRLAAGRDDRRDALADSVDHARRGVDRGHRRRADAPAEWTGVGALAIAVVIGKVARYERVPHEQRVEDRAQDKRRRDGTRHVEARGGRNDGKSQQISFHGA